MNTRQTDPGGGVAARIGEMRRAAGLTQGALAALVGVTADTVGSWEGGRRTPSEERLAAVAFHCEAARAGKTARAGADCGERSSPASVMAPREERMRALVGAIADCVVRQGYPPSMKELKDATGFTSKSVVSYVMDWCEEAGLIARARGMARAVTLTEAGRAFAEATSEAGPAVVRREDPAPDGSGAAAAPDVATGAQRPPRGGDGKTPARRGANATTARQTDPGSGVAARIREARRGAGLTQAALAALVGVSARTVSDWEGGRKTPSEERLAAVVFHCETAGAGATAGGRRLPVWVPREERMRALVDAIADYVAKHGYPPSMQELMDESGFGSKSVVGYSLDACEEAGLIVRERGVARAVTLTEAGRAFAQALRESGGPPVVRREDPAPGVTGAAARPSGRPAFRAVSEDPAPDATGAVAAPDVATDAGPAPRRGDRKTPVGGGAKAMTAGQSDPASGIAARIREARRSVDLTQRELAALIGVSVHTVWCWEAGRTNPTYEHRVAIASHCETDVEALEGRTGPERDRLHEAVVAFRGAVAQLPEQDMELIWTFIRFLRWRRRGRRRAA